MHRPPQPGPQAVEGQDRSGPPPPTGGTMPTATKSAPVLPKAGWGETANGKPTFVQLGEEILPAPYLEGHYAWWVSRSEGWTRWTYKPGQATAAKKTTPRKARVKA